MIKRKSLEDYANSKKAQALRCTIEKKNYLYIEAVSALCQCAFSIRGNRKVNIEAFKLSDKALGGLYQFGYEEFIQGTKEANLALCYIHVLAFIECNNFNIDFSKSTPLKFYELSKINSITLLSTKFEYHKLSDKMMHSLNNILFQIEYLCSEWEIDLHYFVDITLNNMEHNNKIGI